MGHVTVSKCWKKVLKACHEQAGRKFCCLLFALPRHSYLVYLQANGGNAVTARQFMDWLAMEPQSMVWLPVFHRLATSESCRHQAKCSLCKTTPIVGLR